MRPAAQARRVALALAAVVAVIGGLLSQPGEASAHPLGNFTINSYSRIEVAAHSVNIRYVLDMAEVPTFQRMASIDLDGDGQVSDAERTGYLASETEKLVRGLQLSANGSAVGLAVVDEELSFPSGQGGLSTLRLGMRLRGQLPTVDQGAHQRLYYRDDNYAERIGWKEIIVVAGQGAALIDSTAPQQDTSNELRSYPEGMLESAPNIREAFSTFTRSAAPPVSEVLAPAAVESKAAPEDFFTSLVTADRLSAPVVALAVMLALALGAAHAISPGHGKTIMAAYLVGSRGTAWHAVVLGLTVTVSHSIGVVALGAVVLYASHLVAPEDLYPWLGLVSGAIVVAIGSWLLVSRLRAYQNNERHEHHHHHDGDHHHVHEDPGTGKGASIGWKGLAALGVANGVVPSASALLILLAAVSLHRVGLGILLIFAFSAGMAAVLAGVGLLLVYARSAIERAQFQSRMVGVAGRLVPLAAAVVVLVLGIAFTTRALFQVGLV